MIVSYHIRGRKSKIYHGVNMHWNGHFRETHEPPQPRERQGQFMSKHQGPEKIIIQ